MAEPEFHAQERRAASIASASRRDHRIAGALRCIALLLVSPCTAASQAQAPSVDSSGVDTSRTATETWLRTELPKIRVRYATPHPLVDHDDDRGRFGAGNAATHALARGERIARIQLDGCTLEVERRFEFASTRPDPFGMVTSVAFGEVDPANISVEPYTHRGFGTTVEAVVVIQARRDLLETVWLRLDGRRDAWRSERVGLPMPSQAIADAVVLHLRRLAALCQAGA